jgi:hypothetical protein
METNSDSTLDESLIEELPVETLAPHELLRQFERVNIAGQFCQLHVHWSPSKLKGRLNI